jgi:hypothetical protein
MSAVYVEQASILSPLPPEEIEKVIAKKGILLDCARLEPCRYYWLGVEKAVEIKITEFAGRHSLRVATVYQNRLNLSLARFQPGNYKLSLHLGNKELRAIDLNVTENRGACSRCNEDGDSVNYVIQIPDNFPSLFDRIRAILHRHNFCLENTSNGRTVFNCTLNTSWTVLVMTYSNLNSIFNMENDVKFASDVLLFLRDDNIIENVVSLERITHPHGKLMDLTVKSTSVPRQSVENTSRSITSSAKLALSKLNMIRCLSSKMTMSAAKVRRAANSERDLLDTLLVENLALPTYDSRRVYLTFTYHTNEFTTSEMAQQFTSEILSGEHEIHLATGEGFSRKVYVSCSVHCFWLLNRTLDSVAKNYPSLKSVQELFCADIDGIMALQDLLGEMNEDNVPRTPLHRFYWPAKDWGNELCGTFILGNCAGGCNRTHEDFINLELMGVCEIVMRDLGECKNLGCTRLHPRISWD